MNNSSADATKKNFNDLNYLLRINYKKALFKLKVKYE